LSYLQNNVTKAFLSGTGTQDNDYKVNTHTGKDWWMWCGGNFGVTNEGKLYATDADISGKITADEGSIGGWTLEKGTSGNSNYSSLTSGKIGEEGSVHLYTYYPNTTGVSIGGSENKTDWRFTIGSKFGVDKFGKLYCNEGKIGNWEIRTDWANNSYSIFGY
jgi:hypothetical protein